MRDNIKKRFVPVIVAVLAVVVALAAVISTAAVFLTVANVAVLSVDSDIANSVSDKDWDKDYDCIFVLGAGLQSDGTPSAMLADRLKVAFALYEDGVSDVIVLSGDRSGEDYDEVTAMRKYLEDLGVSPDAIVEDGAGYSTYESMYNLKSTGNYHKIVVVTQKYHLYRAMYIAEKMGISADGADATLRGYRNQMYRELREVVARAKDFLMVRFDGESI